MWEREAPIIVPPTPWTDHPVIVKCVVFACFAFLLWVVAGRPWPL